MAPNMAMILYMAVPEMMIYLAQEVTIHFGVVLETTSLLEMQRI